MCGLAGFLSLSREGERRARVSAMTATLKNRGPDASGIYVDDQSGVALGHRRLAVLDLSPRGAQPMHSHNGRYVIVFNGEIYNHLALRAELEQREHVAWLGTSDTETLLAGFSVWGVVETLRKSVGMFALALWDRAERQLTLARDRFGEKPLYYGFVGTGGSTALVFGSELKALRAHPNFDNAIDRDALALFLRYSYVPAPFSIYENTFKLKPGAILTISAAQVPARAVAIDYYWHYRDVALAGLAAPFGDEIEAIDELERVLKTAVGLQLAADVPVGAFLSGGIDSSTIVALMQAQSTRKVKTFTVGFEDSGYDEAPHARAVAKHFGTDHSEVLVTAAEARSVIPILPSMYDEPFGDSSQIPTSIICAAARRSVTVALSGDGGDELLGGYNRHVIGPKLWSMLAVAPPLLRRVLGAGIAHIPDRGWSSLAHARGLGRSLASFKDKAYKIGPALGAMRNIDDLYGALVTEWIAEESPALRAVPTRFDASALAASIADPAHRMMLLDGVTYLPDDILTKVDRAAMAVSLETRVPMLDHRVAEIAWRLPIPMKIRDGRGKWALRQILHRYAPAELFERPKAGFAIPIGHWLRGSLRDWTETLLAERRLLVDDYIDAGRARQLWLEHREGKVDWTGRLWNILMFQAWLEAQSTERPFFSDSRGKNVCHE